MHMPVRLLKCFNVLYNAFSTAYAQWKPGLTLGLKQVYKMDSYVSEFMLKIYSVQKEMVKKNIELLRKTATLCKIQHAY